MAAAICSGNVTKFARHRALILFAFGQTAAISVSDGDASWAGAATEREGALSSELGTHQAVKAKLRPWIKPFSVPQSVKPFKLIPPDPIWEQL